MIEVKIIVIDGNTTEIKTADIDPSATFERIKKSIVQGLELGNPDEYSIFISPKSGNDPLQNYIPSNGDKITIIKNDHTSENPVKFR